MRAFVVTAILSLVAVAGFAAADTSPYQGMTHRAIKALSDREMSDLAAGKGMSLALAAELNGYPGPRHVLDLAEPLGLSPEQITAFQSMFDAMQADASALGTAIISSEADLEHGFRTASLNADSLNEKVMGIAVLRGQLRATHLRFHLSTRDRLDRAQLARYDQLRGYGTGQQHHGHHQSK
ncbi:hypothetical protein BAL199_02874 [alpha proteobacterium BAL199]|jgi:hypothetical protein|nr:hypothetical protein BAL199_02874 [alpha proteobacterium BAL199]